MVSKMKNKAILTYMIIVFLFAFMLFIGGCKPIPENIIETVDETETIEDSEKSGSEEVDPEDEDGQTEQEDGENNPEDNIEDEEIIEEEESGPPEFVELSAKHLGGTPGSITMFFDLVNGKVSGNLEMEYTEVSLDGNQTSLCVYDIKGEINGTVDLETRVIIAEFIGEADSEDRGCYKGDLKFSLKGKIGKDYNVARGTTTYGGVDWSVFD